jgi:hypothetical protein
MKCQNQYKQKPLAKSPQTNTKPQAKQRPFSKNRTLVSFEINALPAAFENSSSSSRHKKKTPKTPGKRFKNYGFLQKNPKIQQKSGVFSQKKGFPKG